MASNILRSFQNNNSINLLNKLRNLRPSLENRVMYLSSDESKQLKKIEKNDWELKDRLTHTGQVFILLIIINYYYYLIVFFVFFLI